MGVCVSSLPACFFSFPSSLQKPSINPSSDETVSTVLAFSAAAHIPPLGVYVGSILAGAFGFGIGLDLGVSAFWDRWNRGVRLTLLILHLLNSSSGNGKIFVTDMRAQATTNRIAFGN
jgi:hypothetical protein